MLHVFSQFNNNNAAEAESILFDALNADFESVKNSLVTQILEGGAGNISSELAEQLIEQEYYQPFSAILEGDGYVRVNLKLVKPSANQEIELPSTIHVVVKDPGVQPLNSAPFTDPIDI